ncbi:MAG TPA: hypothetical protein VF121_14785 [Thermoanaerobaculia bacterium]|nr:hypothetical protein [Thermoanaerobaculia bacterium]
MSYYHLPDDAVSQLCALPETGMGLQLVQAKVLGEIKPLLVFNCERALDLAVLNLTPTQDPAALARNEQLIVDALRQTTITLVTAPHPSTFKLLSVRLGPLAQPTATAALAARPSSLVKTAVLSAPRLFHRFSALNPDRRVHPVTKDFLAGTYASPDAELPFLPTGFAAVGRLALPNSLPASHHYTLRAPAGTSVWFGTVTPAFGQAGGGVEALFSPRSRTRRRASRLLECLTNDAPLPGLAPNPSLAAGLTRGLARVRPLNSYTVGG